MCSAGTSHSQKAHVMPSGEQTRTCDDRMPHSPQGDIPQHLWVLKAPDVEEKSGCAFCPCNGGSRCAGTSHSQKAHVMPSGEQTRTCDDRMPHSPQGDIPQHLWVLKAPDVEEKSGCAFCPCNGGSRCAGTSHSQKAHVMPSGEQTRTQGDIPQHLWVLKAPDVEEKSGCAFCPCNGGSRCGLLDVWFSSLAFFFFVRQ
ncbi:hypothetical protein Emed_006854 [Eimeria media]